MLAAAFCTASVTGHPVPAKREGPRRSRGIIKNIVAQSGRGTIVGFHRNTTSRKKPANIDLQLDSNAQVSLDILPTSQLGVQGVTLAADRVFGLLTPGIPVDVEWIHSPEDDTRSVVALIVRTVELEGVIKRIGGGRLEARVRITRAQNPPAPLMLPIAIPSTQPVPESERDLVFNLKPNCLTISLNGRKSDLRWIRPHMRFAGTAMDGGAHLLFILNATESRPLPKLTPRGNSPKP